MPTRSTTARAARPARTAAIEEHAVEEHFVRSPGPGGQHVNKVATSVELRYHVNATALSAAAKARLRSLAGRRMHADGYLVIESHAERSQVRNREAARERLAALIARALVAPKRRRATAPTRASKESRIEAKKQHGTVKAARRRPRADE